MPITETDKRMYEEAIRNPKGIYSDRIIKKYQQKLKKPEQKEEEQQEEIRPGQSALLGAADTATYGLIPPVYGALNVAIGRNYGENAQHAQNLFSRAHADNPAAFNWGGFVGGIAPALATGGAASATGAVINTGRQIAKHAPKFVAGAKELVKKAAGYIPGITPTAKYVASSPIAKLSANSAIEGAAQSGGHSNYGDITSNALSGGMVGGAAGLGLGVLGKGVMAAANSDKSQPIREGIKKMSRVIGRLPEEVTETLLDNPKLYTDATPHIRELRGTFIKYLDGVNTLINKAEAIASSKLDPYPTIGVDYLKDILTRIEFKSGIKKLKQVTGPDGITRSIIVKSPFAQRAFAQKKINEIRKNLNNYSDALKYGEISEVDLRKIVQNISDETNNWGNPDKIISNRLLKNIRNAFDGVLKKNPEYKRIMDKEAPMMKIKDYIDENFGIKYVERMATPTDLTTSKLHNYLIHEFSPRSANKDIMRENLRRLGIYNKQNLDKQLQGTRLHQLAAQEATAGSRLTNMGTGTGTAVGSLTGGLIGGAIGGKAGAATGAGIGAVTGAGVGNLIGASLDPYARDLIIKNVARFGPQVRALDEGMQKWLSFIPEKYVPTITDAMQRGINATMTADFVLQGRDPQYKEATEDYNPFLKTE